MNPTTTSKEDVAMPASLPTRKTKRTEDAREFQALYLICLALFLPAAIAARILPAGWRPWPPTDRSILGEARAAASAFVPFAMMG